MGYAKSTAKSTSARASKSSVVVARQSAGKVAFRAGRRWPFILAASLWVCADAQAIQLQTFYTGHRFSAQSSNAVARDPVLKEAAKDGARPALRQTLKPSPKQAPNPAQNQTQNQTQIQARDQTAKPASTPTLKQSAGTKPGSSGAALNSSIVSQAASAPASVTAGKPATLNPADTAPTSGRWSARGAAIALGLAAGLGLTAFASYFGFAEEFGAVLLLALTLVAIMTAIRFWTKRRTGYPAPTRLEPSYAYGGVGQEAMLPPQYSKLPSTTAARIEPVVVRPPGDVIASSKVGGRVPAQFDVEGFAHQAKLQYLRLQAAHDAGDLNQLRELTTAELFSDLKAEIEARGQAVPKTEVLVVNVELLGVQTGSHEHNASVRFSGSIREQPDLIAQVFDEVWQLTKPTDGSSGWVLAGVQQLH